MTEFEFKDRWFKEKPMYEAWGRYVVSEIERALVEKGKKLEGFLKIPARCRLKDDVSLVDKAFYRPGKHYSDPYNQIEDKVGVRFVVLLLDDIKDLCQVIERHKDWSFDPSKHFDEDKEKNPLLFTYQSVHYIVRPKKTIEIDGVAILPSIPCEVQIRTLLQHAHAELTHDAIYKAKRTIKPKVHRTVAKSMALIETTDDFFIDVTRQLNSGPLEEHRIIDRLDGIYHSLTGLRSHNQKSTIAIWDEFEQFISENLVDEIQVILKEKPFLGESIKKQYSQNAMYQQSTILFVYWMLEKKKRRLLSDWPFPQKLLEPLATDLGVNLHID